MVTVPVHSTASAPASGRGCTHRHPGEPRSRPSDSTSAGAVDISVFTFTPPPRLASFQPPGPGAPVRHRMAPRTMSAVSVTGTSIAPVADRMYTVSPSARGQSGGVVGVHQGAVRGSPRLSTGPISIGRVVHPGFSDRAGAYRSAASGIRRESRAADRRDLGTDVVVRQFHPATSGTP